MDLVNHNGSSTALTHHLEDGLYVPRPLLKKAVEFDHSKGQGRQTKKEARLRAVRGWRLKSELQEAQDQGLGLADIRTELLLRERYF